MANTVTDYVLSLWTSRKTKKSSTGWIAGNGVCCTHNGETSDRRGRAGIVVNSDESVAYSCFNCNFRTIFKPGEHLSFKFRRLLSWMGADESDIQRMVFEAIRIREQIDSGEYEGVYLDITEKPPIKFEPVALPAKSIRFADLTEDTLTDEFAACVSYIHDRRIDLDSYDFYCSPASKGRVIIPFTHEGKVIGYSARSIIGQTPKYINCVDSHYVFNLDKQTKSRKVVIVSEGPFDAMSVDGVAVLHNEVHEDQADQIDALCRKVIVVPHADISGGDLVQSALKYGWSVSFPLWTETCKDINEAACKYGKLFTLKAILEGVEDNPLKIKLRARKLYGGK